MGKVAQALKAAAQKLDEQDQSKLSNYTTKAAGKLEELSHYLLGKDIHQLFDDTKRFGKEHPALLCGSAFAVGFLVARFFKHAQKKRQIPQDDLSPEDELFWEKGV